MAQSDVTWKDMGEVKVDDDGMRIRGQHYMRESGPPADHDDPMPGLWIGHAGGCARHFLDIQEFGDGSQYPKCVEIEREEIPKVIEALIERCYPRDIDDIRDRVDRALEDREGRGKELVYSER